MLFFLSKNYLKLKFNLETGLSLIANRKAKIKLKESKQISDFLVFIFFSNKIALI